jgi:hypothetical protein
VPVSLSILVPFLIPIVYWAVPGGRGPQSLGAAIAYGAGLAVAGAAYSLYRLQRRRSEPND